LAEILFVFLTKFLIFDQNFELLAKILIFIKNLNFWPKEKFVFILDSNFDF